MPNTVEITVWWNSEQSSEFKLECEAGWGWRVRTVDGVPLLILREKDGVRHEIPIDNVLYWTVNTPVPDRSETDNPTGGRYCQTCDVQVNAGNFLLHPVPTHDVRRTCCGSPSNAEHYPSCPTRHSSTSQSGFTKDRVNDYLTIKAAPLANRIVYNDIRRNLFTIDSEFWSR